MILAIRTDKPEAELYLYQKGIMVDSLLWLAHRELSDTLLIKIEELLKRNHAKLKDLTSIGVFKGPGSFTGLRIGISVANTLAYSLNIPVSGAEGESWISDIKESTSAQSSVQVVVPEYGGEAHITKPRK